MSVSWYNVRDMFFGENMVKQDILGALRLAKDCKHPDALYLTNIFNEKNVHDPRSVFLEQPETDARALCFSEMVNNVLYDSKRIEKSAKLGFAYAQAKMLLFEGNDTYFIASAMQDERDGFYALGMYLKTTRKKNAKENFLKAAKLGHVYSMIELDTIMDYLDPKRWFWLGEAAKRGMTRFFLVNFQNFVQYPDCNFQIGRVLSGQVGGIRKTLFGHWHSDCSKAIESVAFYKHQLICYRDAVNTWTLVGLYFKVVKDIRILIGKMIWESREEGEY